MGIVAIVDVPQADATLGHPDDLKASDKTSMNARKPFEVVLSLIALHVLVQVALGDLHDIKDVTRRNGFSTSGASVHKGTMLLEIARQYKPNDGLEEALEGRPDRLAPGIRRSRPMSSGIG